MGKVKMLVNLSENACKSFIRFDAIWSVGEILLFHFFSCFVVISLPNQGFCLQTTFSIDPASGTQIVHKYVQWYLDNHLMEDSKHFKTMLAVTVLLISCLN